jgi:Skp family chaperone for outer membrane proteins
MQRLAFLIVAFAFSTVHAFAQTTAQPPARPAAPVPQPVAQPPAPFPADAKIAFVNLQFVFSESTLGKQGNERLKVFNDKLFAGLSARDKEIQGLSEKIKTQQSAIEASVLKVWTNDLQRLQREAQFAQQEARVQSSQLQQEVFADFERRIVPVLDTLRVEKRLHAIFAVQPEGGGLTLLSYDPGLDLSSEVVKRLNALK